MKSKAERTLENFQILDGLTNSDLNYFILRRICFKREGGFCFQKTAPHWYPHINVRGYISKGKCCLDKKFEKVEFPKGVGYYDLKKEVFDLDMPHKKYDLPGGISVAISGEHEQKGFWHMFFNKGGVWDAEDHSLLYVLHGLANMKKVFEIYNRSILEQPDTYQTRRLCDDGEYFTTERTEKRLGAQDEVFKKFPAPLCPPTYLIGLPPLPLPNSRELYHATCKLN